MKLLIFDFDGTIVDSKALYYRVIYNQLKILGFSYKQVDKAIDLGLSLRKTLRNLGLPFIDSWFMHKKIMKNIESHINEIKKCRDVDEIKQLNNKNKTEKILISNSLKEFVMPVLKHLKLKQCFQEIYGSEDFTDKEEFIKDYLKQKRIRKQDCYYIGDRTADVKLARTVNIQSIIIAGKCAWDSRAEILEEKPDFIIDDLKDLKKILVAK